MRKTAAPTSIDARKKRHINSKAGFMSYLASNAKQAQFTCKRSENVFVAIEKCLDNGLGICFVVDDDRRLVSKITLDEIRGAILDGSAIKDTSLERHLLGRDAAVQLGFNPLRNDPSPDGEMVMPVVDGDGRLTDVLVDRSKQFVQVAKPDLSHREFRAVLDAFVSSWISSKGTYIPKFEEEFASFVGMSRGVAVSNGTVALHLALLALGVGPGDEVIVPDLTFAATINAVIYCGAVPIIVDVDEKTWTMSLAQVERARTPRTKAIIPVHLYGRPAEIGPITAFAKQHGIYVVEDCAEAHGTRYAGRTVGQFGDISCFSFYANKIVTTGEGGMCLTDSAALATTIATLRDHGMAPDRSFWHERVGYNYRMTNLQAAIGQSQLWRIDQTLARNKHLEERYHEHLRDIPGVTFPPPLAEEYESVVWLVCVQVPAQARSRLIEAGRAAQIEMRPFFHSLSALPPYEKYARPCPNSVALSQTGINLPTSTAVDVHVMEKIAAVFRDVLC
jgi:perosamine synthetase